MQEQMRLNDFKESAKRYWSAHIDLRDAENAARTARQKESECREGLDRAAKALGGFVGANIRSRCASLDDGTIVANYNVNGPVLIQVFDKDGKSL